MKKLKESTILKAISYILFPILVGLIIISLIQIIIIDENEEVSRYEETQTFADNYIYFIIDKIENIEVNEIFEMQNFVEIEDLEGNKHYYSSDYYEGVAAYIDYIIIDRQTQKMYTNLKSTDYKEVINEMKNAKTYWVMENGEINTDIEKIDEYNIRYNRNYQYLNLHGTFYYSLEKKLENYDIYTRYDETKSNVAINYDVVKSIYVFLIENQKLSIYTLPISLIFVAIIIIYLLLSIGHEKGSKQIKLNVIDKIPYEILSIMSMIFLVILLSITGYGAGVFRYIIIGLIGISYILCYLICAIWAVSTIKRIKAKIFLKSFITYKIIKWTINKLKKMKEDLDYKTKDIKKIFWQYWIFMAICFVCVITRNSLMMFLAFALVIVVYYEIRKYIRKQDEIKKALEKIYNGDTNIDIEENQLKGTLKQMVIYINDIAGGFSNAIEQNLKAERLKTELITNVSHDIKTPLTSIINYVDLLKKEDIKNEKIIEYIEILDSKSQRLKKLTEDLVEASKASSGNVKLNIEEIKVKELINQSIGEYKDKFEEKQLLIETTIPVEDIKIKADNRYLYRIIENLFGNITKYAQESSRVYIDVIQNGKEVSIIIKNISKEKLNISSEELMQRFVRGDKARYTEGSGLRIINS